MFRSILMLGAIGLSSASLAEEFPIVGNVESKCTIYSDTAGVYGNPTPDELSTDATDGGIQPIVRYDVAVADYYTAKISYPTEFSTSPNLTDALNWTGDVEVSSTSSVDMSGYEAAKVQYDSTTEFDLTAAGSTWFKITSNVTYGYSKSLPGGEYRAMIQAECIAN